MYTDFQNLLFDEKKTLIDSIDTIVTDCDGVIWDTDGVINDAHQAVEKLIKQGKSVHYVTNNSTRNKAQLVSKFKKLGFSNVTEDSVIHAASLAASYIHENLRAGKSVYVIGAPAVCEELGKFSIQCFGPSRDFALDISTGRAGMRQNVGAVVVGNKYFSYPKMALAASYLKDENCLFVSTDLDESFPLNDGFVMPGAGAIVASIQVASGREPIVVGKPSIYLSGKLKDRFNPKKTLFIGDRLNVDMLIGKKCDFTTLFVQTGSHTLEDVKKYEMSGNPEDRICVPDYYTFSFSDLIFEYSKTSE